MCANRVKLSWIRFKRSFLPVLLAVITLAIPRIPSGFAMAADNPENAANTGLLPVPLNMSAMESAETTQSPENASWQDTMNAGIDDMSGQVGQASGMLNLFKTAGEIAGKVENADQFTKTMKETGKFAEAFGEVFSVISEILDLAKLGMQIYDCVTALVLDEEEVFVEAFNTLVRNLVVSLASEAGTWLGRTVGAMLGSGVASIVTGALGGVLGGWLGKKIAGGLYDFIVVDYVKNFARSLVGLMKGPPKSVCTDLKYAAFAWGTYGDKDPLQDLLPFPENFGWQEGATEVDDEISYSSTVYQHSNARGDIDEVVVSFQGTTFTSAEDWVNNIVNGVGFIAPQYAKAGAYAKEITSEIKSKYPGAKISFTGHSLGGGLAQYAAALTNQTAVTFNTASPSTFLLEYKGIDINSVDLENRITNYVHQNDPLHKVNLETDGEGWTSHLGNDINVAGWETFIKAHGISTMWKHFAQTCITPLNPPKGIIPPRGTIQEPSTPSIPPGLVVDPIILPPTVPVDQPPGTDPSQPVIEPWKSDSKKANKQEEYQRHKNYDELVQ